MKLKNPILTFSILVFLFGLFIFFFIYGFWGIGAILWLYGIYAILILVSFLLKKLKIAERQIIEWSLIIVYVLSHTLYYFWGSLQKDIYYEKWGISWLYRWMRSPKQRYAWIRQAPDLSDIEKTYYDILMK